MRASILLAYYPGAYDPTVRIASDVLQHITELRRLLRLLAGGEVVEVSLGDALRCDLDSVEALHLRVVSEHGRERSRSKSWVAAREDPSSGGQTTQKGGSSARRSSIRSFGYPRRLTSS